MNAIIRFVREEDGTNAIEYGMLCSLILLAIVGAVTLMAQNGTAMWASIAAHI